MQLEMPAISLSALPERRHQIIEFAKESEERGFSGIYMPSLGDNMGLATAVASVTKRIMFGTSICPIYFRSTFDLAQSAAFIHEISNGRFRFGIGVAHSPSHQLYGVEVGKPLLDIRKFVADARAFERIGDLPPIVLATLRKKMIALAGEIGDGMVFANGSRSHMPESLRVLSEKQRHDRGFFIGNMIPICIDEDVKVAATVNRKTLVKYSLLPNYRNYWKEAGYEEEMSGVEKAILKGGDLREVAKSLSERWLSDNTLYGPPSKILEGLEEWYAVGIKTPILVPSSANGNQIKAIKELFELCARLR
jgi:alkanesulfonate monooxygenase SsuD/methylene tetrahydromethanopterin reductase-like flavin-dependent oxidoreductase (luciferase family)